MAFADRQARVRVFDELERAAKRFRSGEDMWPVRVPREPIDVGELITRALPEDHHRFDPESLRSRTLLHLEWDDESAWDLWVVVLPSGLKLFCDAGPEGLHLLASGGRHANDESDRLCLQLLAESAGQQFGIELAGGAPTRVRSSIADRPFLVDIFVHLFEVSGAETSVRAQLAESGARVPVEERVLGDDFRHEVELWLDRALRP